MKDKQKERAIQLRKSGKTYSEILKVIPVAKSTLSLWLRSVNLTKRQQQTLTEKKLMAIRRGGQARMRERIERTERIKELAKSEIGTISTRELWLMGIMLYWAEGTKEKKYRTGHLVVFSNSDVRMIKLFLLWLTNCVQIPSSAIHFCLYIHETHNERISDHRAFWNQAIGMRYNTLEKVYLKKNKLSSGRKNVGQDYHGQLFVLVRNSIDLNRRIAGWTEGVCLRCGVV